MIVTVFVNFVEPSKCPVTEASADAEGFGFPQLDRQPYETSRSVDASEYSSLLSQNSCGNTEDRRCTVFDMYMKCICRKSKIIHIKYAWTC